MTVLTEDRFPPTVSDQLIENLSEGFERELYQAAMSNLDDECNKLRFNNFAYAMRELVRHVLCRLAPDSSVVQCDWYKNETMKLGGVTRRQRAIFSVQGGLSNDYIKNTLGMEVDDIHKALIKAIDNLSKFTHIEPNTFGLGAAEVGSHASQTLMAVSNLFDTISNCQQQIIESLWKQIDDSVVDEALRETIASLDELASHHAIEEISVEDVTIGEIGHDRILITANGTISCELQWGSGSDVRRGDGVVVSESYPFVCNLYASVNDPSSIEGSQDGIQIDTSSWRDESYDREAK